MSDVYNFAGGAVMTDQIVGFAKQGYDTVVFLKGGGSFTVYNSSHYDFSKLLKAVNKNAEQDDKE